MKQGDTVFAPTLMRFSAYAQFVTFSEGSTQFQSEYVTHAESCLEYLKPDLILVTGKERRIIICIIYEENF